MPSEANSWLDDGSEEDRWSASSPYLEIVVKTHSSAILRNGGRSLLYSVSIECKKYKMCSVCLTVVCKVLYVDRFAGSVGKKIYVCIEVYDSFRMTFYVSFQILVSLRIKKIIGSLSLVYCTERNVIY